MTGERVGQRESARRGRLISACVAAVLSAAFVGAPGSASDAPKPAASKDVLHLSVEPVHERVMETARRTGEWIADAYKRSPMLVICLGLAGALPLLAGLFAAGRSIRRDETTPTATASIDVTPLGGKAWIEIGEPAVPIAFTGELLRIGRHSDNDVALDHESVHRHHALIQRTPDDEFILIDLTAGRGNQPLLNGRAVERARLAAGDRIGLGDAELTFRVGLELPSGTNESTHPPMTSAPFAREALDDDGDTTERTTGRPADRVQTRRIKPSDGLAARGADRGRS